jgi:hypothetical protein
LAGLGRFHLDRELAGLLEQRLLVLALRLRDLLAQRLLLSTQAFVVGDGRAPGGVGLEQLVDKLSGLTAPSLGGLDAFGLLPQDAKVDHPPSLPRAADHRGPITEPGE